MRNLETLVIAEVLNIKGVKQMATKGHEIVIKTENYLRSIGKNNSTGKYDRIVQGVKSLLEQGFLEGDRLEGAIKQEADRLLRKYNLDAKTVDKVYDPVLCMMVDADKVSTRDRYFDVSYSVGNGIFSGVMVQANSEQEAIEKAKKHSPHIARAEKVAASPSSVSVESARMRGKSVIDSVSSIDKAIKTIDSSFYRTFFERVCKQALKDLEECTDTRRAREIYSGAVSHMEEAVKEVKSELAEFQSDLARVYWPKIGALLKKERERK